MFSCQSKLKLSIPRLFKIFLNYKKLQIIQGKYHVYFDVAQQVYTFDTFCNYV